MANVGTYLIAQIAGLINGGIGGALSTVTRLIGAGARQLTDFHQEGIAFARDMGMSLEQAQAYTATLTKNTADLAKQYGVAADQIKAVQRNLSEATNRQLMLNSSQVEGFVALNKLVGDSTVSKFAEEMMTGMGAQVSTVEGAISKAYVTSAKNGLNAKKVSADIANNLSMMNKLSFRNGVDGLTKMAVQAQKVGMSLSQVESVARTFMDFDQSIEHAAQLQMLGGAAGAMGGNPLDMMYEANYDPEALQDRMIKMMSGYATFDANTGMSKINGMGMDFIRNIAKAMGMDEGEAVKVAKKNAEIQYKTEKLGGMQGLSEDQKSAIINKSYVENGRVYVNDENDNKVDITGGNIPPELAKFLSKYEGMDELDIMKEQARELTSINESINGFWESAKAEFAKAFNDLAPGLLRFVKEIGPLFINAIKPMAVALQNTIKTVLTPENIERIIKTGVGIFNAIGTVSSFLTKHWPLLVGLIAANKMLGFKGGSKLGGASAKAGAPRSVWGKANQAYKAARIGGTRSAAVGAGAKALGKSLLKTGGVGLIAGGAGMAGNYFTDKAAEEGKIEKGGVAHSALKAVSTGAEYAAIGATIGSIIPGVGTGIGAGAGFIAGAIKGLVDAQKSKNEANTAVEKAEPHAEGGIVGGNSYTGDRILTRLNSGEMVLSREQQTGLFNAIKKLTTPIIPGISNIFNTNNANSRHTIQTREVTIQNIGGNRSATNLFNPISHIKNVGMMSGLGMDIMRSIIRGKNFSSIKGVAPIATKIEAKPVGHKEYINTRGYHQQNSQSINGNVKVNDFNINLGGTLRLDGGNSSKNLDVKELLKDPQFVNALKDAITNAISSSYNGGRHMNDIATMRGLPAQTTTWGRRGN